MVSQAVVLSGLTQLKKEFQSKYGALVLTDIRLPTLWTPFDD